MVRKYYALMKYLHFKPVYPMSFSTVFNIQDHRNKNYNNHKTFTEYLI